MDNRICIKIQMELQSDAILGSGHSTPGGEDIALRLDSRGYPCLGGATFKGLLRESVENLLVWQGAQDCTALLFGTEGRGEGAVEGRRIRLTGLTVSTPTQPPEDVVCTRVFTKLDAETGTVETGTLRMAAAAKSGLVLEGFLWCSSQDEELIREGLQGLKYVGTMRSRGFGLVKIACKKNSFAPICAISNSASGDWIHYQLRLKTPLQLTQAKDSFATSFDTMYSLAGSAVRGMVLGQLAEKSADFFEEHKRELLGNQVRFLQAIPVDFTTGKAGIPSPKGFYADKLGQNLTNILTGSLQPGMKRAKIGAFSSFEGENLVYWTPKTGGGMRVNVRESDAKGGLFQTRWLEPEQLLDGYCYVENDAIKKKIMSVFQNEVLWFGADQFAGSGACVVEKLEIVNAPEFSDFGYQLTDKIPKTLYMCCLSPLAMQNPHTGEWIGLDLEVLAEKLGVTSVSLEGCASSIGEVSGYNRTWGCRLPANVMYDSGTVFRLDCSQAPSQAALVRLETEGLGIRRGEGFGQVLFLKNYSNIQHINSSQPVITADKKERLSVRLEEIQWLRAMKEKTDLHKGGLSKSQLGSIQQLLVSVENMDIAEIKCKIEEYFARQESKGAKHFQRYKGVQKLLNQTVLSDGLVAVSRDVRRKIQLVCELIDFSRKEDSR